MKYGTPPRVRRMNFARRQRFQLRHLGRRVGFAHLEAGILKLLADLFRRKHIESERAQDSEE